MGILNLEKINKKKNRVGGKETKGERKRKDEKKAHERKREKESPKDGKVKIFYKTIK